MIQLDGDTATGRAHVAEFGRFRDGGSNLNWWVTSTAYERGDYALVYEAVGDWIGGALPFDAPLYPNLEIPPREP
jgi:hypothetical protein